MTGGGRAIVLVTLMGSFTVAASTESRPQAPVTVITPVRGATVFVDDHDVGIAPMAPITLPPGTYRFRVRRPGLIDFASTVVVTDPPVPVLLEARPTEVRSLLSVLGSSGLLRVDGREFGSVPLREAPVEPGLHRIDWMVGGQVQWTTSVESAPYAHAVVQVGSGATSADDPFSELDPVLGSLADDIEAPSSASTPVRPTSSITPITPITPTGSTIIVTTNLSQNQAIPVSNSLTVHPAVPTLSMPVSTPSAAMESTSTAPVVLRPMTAGLRVETPRVSGSPPSPPARQAPPMAVGTSGREALDEDHVKHRDSGSVPLWRNPWMWSAATLGMVVALVAAVAVAGSTGPVEPVRDPSAICPDCVVVIHP